MKFNGQKLGITQSNFFLTQYYSWFYKDICAGVGLVGTTRPRKPLATLPRVRRARFELLGALCATFYTQLCPATHQEARHAEQQTQVRGKFPCHYLHPLTT